MGSLARRRMRWGWCLGLAAVAAGCASAEPDAAPAFEVEVAVDPSSAHAVRQRVWGLQPEQPGPILPPERVATTLDPAGAAPQGKATEPAPAPQGGATQDPTAKPAPQGFGDEELATLRSRFGPGITVAPDGKRITKQYFLSGEGGLVFQNLLLRPDGTPPDWTNRVVADGAAGQSIIERMLGKQAVEIVYIAKFEVPESVPIRSPASGGPLATKPGQPNDLMLVTAAPAALAAFEGALNLFFANIPQVEIEVKVVEYSTTDALAFGIDVVDLTTPTLNQLSSGKLIQSITSKFPLTAPLVGGVDVQSRGVFKLGGIHDAWELDAQLQMLEAQGIADVLSAPRVIVRNGGQATIATTTDVPYPKARISSSGQNVTADIAFQKTGITLNIRPVIAGHDTVILQVYARVADVTSFTQTDPVPTPTISEREAVTSVHLADGKTTVIGGLVTNSVFDRTSQVPILGDIPILGLLFRSTSKTTSKSTLEFHITPRILRGSGNF